MYSVLEQDLIIDVEMLQTYCCGIFGINEKNYEKVDITRLDPNFFSTLPNLAPLLERCELEVDTAYFFSTEPGVVTPIHADGFEPERSRFCGLNFPIYGCEDTLMNWYGDKPDDSAPRDITSKVPVRFPTDLHEAVTTWAPTHSLELLSPALVSTRHWHNIDTTKSKVNRNIVTIRFKGNPKFDYVAWRLNS